MDLDIAKERGWSTKVELITKGKTDLLDSATNDKLVIPYMKFTKSCNFTSYFGPQKIYFFNIESTPEKLSKHWDKWFLERNSAIEEIQDLMSKFKIKKSEI